MQRYLRKHPSLQAWLLVLPAGSWLFIFFLAPLAIVLVYSFLERGTYGGVEWVFTLDNFKRVFDSLYLETFLKSGYIALLTTLLTLAIGYPIAYFIATRPEKQRGTLLMALMIPFWTNFLIRTYAWLTLLRTNTGLINVTLMNWGLIDKPLSLYGNTFAIGWAWVTGWLPRNGFGPIYAALARLGTTTWVEACPKKIYPPKGKKGFRRKNFPRFPYPGGARARTRGLNPQIEALEPRNLRGEKPKMGKYIRKNFGGRRAPGKRNLRRSIWGTPIFVPRGKQF